MLEFIPLASGSSGNAYVVSSDGTTLLLDAGIPITKMRQLFGFKLGSIDAALITHEHQDHCKAVPDLVRLGVDVYASAGTIDKVGVTGHRVHVMTPLQAVQIGCFSVLPFEAEHDAAEPFGFLCANRAGEKLLYLTDSYYCKYTFSGVAVMAIECNYTEEGLQNALATGYINAGLVPRLRKSHMSLERLLELLAANDLSALRQIYLIHLSQNTSQEDVMKEAVARATGVEVIVC